ncbi:hypothetical protein LX32DRAFT_150050 [Colletotrichum zoysiae]|uniref:Transmembrane protein n=1 Tax=Colletotrichum zoysiae TaxID=1216348 RepID=A0AAD9H6E7_9PEZI|nr:hypothetical protein LX32DRAFT_150050 [Colletotrichum zoysiae]
MKGEGREGRVGRTERRCWTFRGFFFPSSFFPFCSISFFFFSYSSSSSSSSPTPLRPRLLSRHLELSSLSYCPSFLTRPAGIRDGVVAARAKQLSSKPNLLLFFTTVVGGGCVYWGCLEVKSRAGASVPLAFVRRERASLHAPPLHSSLRGSKKKMSPRPRLI